VVEPLLDVWLNKMQTSLTDWLGYGTPSGVRIRAYVTKAVVSWCGVTRFISWRTFFITNLMLQSPSKANICWVEQSVRRFFLWNLKVCNTTTTTAATTTTTTTTTATSTTAAVAFCCFKEEVLVVVVVVVVLSSTSSSSNSSRTYPDSGEPSKHTASLHKHFE